MNCAYLAFTAKGLALAQQLAQTCPGSVSRCGLGGVTLAGWTAQQFAAADALVFVGAAGIAVRAIAPHCQSKATDPAVVVLDECGRFAVPLLSGHLGGAKEKLASLASHGATMVIFLSIGLIDKVQEALLQGAYTASTPAAVVYKATWPEQKTVRCTVGTLAQSTKQAGITKTALIVVGDFLGRCYARSKLYDPAFTTEYREGTKP